MPPRVVITGAAGFIGSHLSETLLDRGWAVVGIDNLLTGDANNIAHLAGRDFLFIKHDVTNYINVDGPVDIVLHWASPASPIDYLELPIQTLKVGALGESIRSSETVEIPGGDVATTGNQMPPASPLPVPDEPGDADAIIVAAPTDAGPAAGPLLAPVPGTGPDSAAAFVAAAPGTLGFGERVAAAATDPMFSSGTGERIPMRDTLVPEFRSRLERVIERMRKEFGYTVEVVETVRSQERQDQLYRQGRVTPGAVVTWTRSSRHTPCTTCSSRQWGGRW